MQEEKNPFSEENIEENEQKEITQEQNSTTEEIKENPEKEEEAKENEPDLSQQLDDLNNKYLRLLADFDNYRKRTLQERDELSKYACADLMKKIIPALDTFDRAQEHLKEIEDVKIVKESYEVAYKQLLDTLKKAGLEEIDCLGKAFNPAEHEAITQIVTDEFEPDTIAQIAQKGYKMENRVIRPSLVAVAVAQKKEDE